MVVSIDIEGAFDNIPFEVITESLRLHGAEEHVIKWIDYLSKNRMCESHPREEYDLFPPYERHYSGWTKWSGSLDYMSMEPYFPRGS